MTDRQQQGSMDPDPQTVRQAQEANPPEPHGVTADPQEAHGGSMAPGLVDGTGHRLDDPGDVGGDLTNSRP
jgi:hypothetical protein